VGHGKTEGVVLGAVAGAAIGAAVDPAKDNRHHNYRSRYVQRDVRPYYGNTRYGDRYDRGREWSQERYGYGSAYPSGYGGYGDRR